MTFQALVVSKDDEAVTGLTEILSEFSVAVHACDYADAPALFEKTKFDAVVVDYDDSDAASAFQKARLGISSTASISIGLSADKPGIRRLLEDGVHFILYKPIEQEQSRPSLRAVLALMKRERRRSFRVPVQLPVQLQVPNVSELEGILLNLSEGGMDVLAAQALNSATVITCQFNLQDPLEKMTVLGEIVWANPNGESGIQFGDLSEETRQSLRNWVTENATELPPAEPEPISQCRLSDLSLGACYVETESPFPERSTILLTLQAETIEVQVEGIVRVMHPAVGMGVEFASRTEKQRDQVRTFIDLLSGTPNAIPHLLVAPRTLHSANQAPRNAIGQESDDPLLELVCSHEYENQEDFLRALRSQRNAEEYIPS